MAVNIVLLGGLVALCASALMSVVACIIYGWAVRDSTFGITYSLWRVCVDVASSTVCDDIDEPSGALNSVRRMLITGIIHTAISIVFACVHAKKTSMTSSTHCKNMVYGTVINGVIAACLLLACSITYGVTYDDDYGDEFDLGPAYKLLNVSLCFILGGAIAVFASFKKAAISPTGGRVMATATVINTGYPQQQHGGVHNPAGPTGYYGPQPPPPYPGYGTPAYPAYPAYGQQPPAPYPGPPASGGYPPANDPAYPPPPAMKY